MKYSRKYRAGLGEHIKRMRRSRGLSQIKLAKNLNVAPATIMQWENRRCIPRPFMVETIIEFLGYKPEMGKQLKEKQFLEALGLWKSYKK